MIRITKEYANTNNGGKERITRDGDKYHINSYIPNVGWMGESNVTREQAAAGLRYTNAPTDLVAVILGGAK